MKTHQLRIAISAYEDHMWCITIVEDVYEEGRRVGSDMVQNAWCELERLDHHVSAAVDRVVALEQGRVRTRDARGRSMPLQRP